MAYVANALKGVSSIGESGVWMYQTSDSLATVEVPGYFKFDKFHIGDRIFVIDGFAGYGSYVVTGLDGVTVVPITANTHAMQWDDNSTIQWSDGSAIEWFGS